MKRMLVFLSMIIAGHAIAQNKKIVIKLVPLALVDDVSFPTIQGGIEFPLSERVSWYNEVGIKYRKGYYETLADTNFIQSKGFKVKTELRYYFKKDRMGETQQPEGYYVAANLFYSKDLHNTGIDYYYKRDTAMKRGDYFGTKKIVFGINFLAGKQMAAGKRFMLDVYAGVGIRCRRVTSTNKEFEYGRDMLIGPIDLTVQGISNNVDAKAGNSIVPNFTSGLRLCYRL